MENLKLENGVNLKIKDESKNLTGDLFQVRIDFIIQLKLGDGDVELRMLSGSDFLDHTRSMIKTPVLRKNLEEVKKGLKDSFLNTNVKYLSRDIFPARMKKKALEELREKAKIEALIPPKAE